MLHTSLGTSFVGFFQPHNNSCPLVSFVFLRRKPTLKQGTAAKTGYWDPGTEELTSEVSDASSLHKEANLHV